MTGSKNIQFMPYMDGHIKNNSYSLLGWAVRAYCDTPQPKEDIPSR